MSDLDLTQLPQATLYAVARNDSAEPRYRKAAVRLMLERGFQQVNHADLSSILADVKADLSAEAEVSDIVEQAIESPLPRAVVGDPVFREELGKRLKVVETAVEEYTGPLKASVTTKTIFGEE